MPANYPYYGLHDSLQLLAHTNTEQPICLRTPPRSVTTTPCSPPTVVCCTSAAWHQSFSSRARGTLCPWLNSRASKLVSSVGTSDSSQRDTAHEELRNRMFIITQIHEICTNRCAFRTYGGTSGYGWQKWASHRKYKHFEKKFSKIHKKFVSQSVLEVGHFILNKKVVFFQNFDFLYRKSCCKFDGIWWILQDLVVFLKCPTLKMDCETNFLWILKNFFSKCLYFLWEAHFCHPYPLVPPYVRNAHLFIQISWILCYNEHPIS